MRLVARIRAGDQQAMSELYDRYGKVVYAVALRVLQDAARRGRRATGRILAAMAQSRTPSMPAGEAWRHGWR